MIQAGGSLRLSLPELVVAGLVLVSCGYFHGGAMANQNARLDAIFAFVEPGTRDTGTFRIDRFLPAPEQGINTVDWAEVGGHYYANKAPGSILLGALAYAGLYYLQTLTGQDPQAPIMALVNSYLINLAVSALWIAIAALLFFRMLSDEIATSRAAWLTLGLFLGTGLFPYATQLWGHVTAAAFLVIGMYELRKQNARAASWGAFWFGLAVVTDYLTATAAVILSLCYLAAYRRHLPRMILGAIPSVSVLLTYQWFCFGSPWTLATSPSNPAFIANDRALGMFAGPDPSAFVQILLGPYRGIFLQMPVLLLVIAGFVHWWRRSRRDPWLWACLLTFLAACLVVAAFNGWHGGATVLQRYLLPFLPVAFLATKELVLKGAGKLLAWVLGGVSVCNMLAIAAVNPLCPESHPNPLYGYTYRALMRGQLAPYDLAIRLLDYDPQWLEVKPWSMWNWGELFGLQGLSTLLPLLVCWALGAALLARTTRTMPR